MFVQTDEGKTFPFLPILDAKDETPRTGLALALSLQPCDLGELLGSLWVSATACKLSIT